MTPPRHLGTVFRSLAALALAAILHTAAAQTPAPASSRQQAAASDAYLAGARALDRRDYTAAEAHFTRALDLFPGHGDYVVALALAREHHVAALVQQAGRERLLGHAASADTLLVQARALDPANPLVAEHTDTRLPASWLTQPPVYAGSIALTPAPAPKSFHLHADIQQIVTQVASAYGLRAVFDDSFIHQSVRFDLDDVTYPEAMPILLQMGRLFAVPLDATTLLVAHDNSDIRQRLERQMEETIFVPGLSPEQMSDLGNIVRNIFDVKQATVENNLGTLVLRAPEPTLTAINLALADLLDGGSEVLLELKLYSVDLTHNRSTGLTVPQQVGAYNLTSEAQNLVTANQTVVNQAIAQGLIPATASVLQIAEYLLASGVATSSLFSNALGIFGGGITTSGVYVSAGATLNFGASRSDVRGLDQIQLRLGARQAGTFRIGSRYPVTTSTYSTGTAALPASLAGVKINGVSASSLLSQYLGTGTGATVPQIQYEDLGLTLKATPVITISGAVHLKLDLKIEALAGGSNDNIPILANRQIVSDVTVNDGESALLLSNVNRSEARAINGLPGLSELPGFQTASDQVVEADSSELVLVLTPHIVRRRSDAAAGPRIAFVPARTGN